MNGIRIDVTDGSEGNCGGRTPGPAPWSGRGRGADSHGADEPSATHGRYPGHRHAVERYERERGGDEPTGHEVIGGGLSTGGAVHEGGGGHIGGKIDIGGEEFRFGSGGRGRQHIPYGTHEITPGAIGTWGARHGAVGIAGGRMWDPTLHRYREGIELHAAHSDAAITAGCVAIAGGRWREAKARVLGMIRQHGRAYLSVGPHGASITSEPPEKIRADRAREAERAKGASENKGEAKPESKKAPGPQSKLEDLEREGMHVEETALHSAQPYPRAYLGHRGMYGKAENEEDTIADLEHRTPGGGRFFDPNIPLMLGRPREQWKDRVMKDMDYNKLGKVEVPSSKDYKGDPDINKDPGGVPLEEFGMERAFHGTEGWSQKEGETYQAPVHSIEPGTKQPDSSSSATPPHHHHHHQHHKTRHLRPRLRDPYED
jgi:hypothetical protein